VQSNALEDYDEDGWGDVKNAKESTQKKKNDLYQQAKEIINQAETFK